MAVQDGVEYGCFVGGLAWATGERDLEAAFRPFGEILDAKIISDRETGRSRGFGFVTFSSEQSMRDAIQGMNGKELGGRSITVNEARPRRHSGGRCGGGSSRGTPDTDSRTGTRSGMNHPTRADDTIFAHFYGGNSDRGEPWRRMADDTFAQFFGLTSLHSPGQPSMHAFQRPHKAAPIEHQLACNLADLYKGTTKKMKISRELSDSSRRRTVVQEILTIDIKPGWIH